MEPEFRALGVDPRQRGKITDAVLDLLERCFAGDVVTENGQPFLFRPRPSKPPVLIGGGPPHALERAARYGDGWLPMALAPEKLARHMATYRALCAQAGRPAGSATVLGALPLADPVAAAERLAAYAEAGAERFVHGTRYEGMDAYRDMVARLAQLSG